MKKIDIIQFQQCEALESYSETPKTMTAVMHANETDDSEFHCVWTGFNREGISKGNPEGWSYCLKKVFTVPRQKIEILEDPTYGMFYRIKVVPQFRIPLFPGNEFWLVAQMSGRSGFLVPFESFSDMEEKVSVAEMETVPA